jgi:hypothetical protein
MLGASARRMLRGLADGETNPETLAALADQRLRVLNAGRDKARMSGISSERVSSISCFKTSFGSEPVRETGYGQEYTLPWFDAQKAFHFGSQTLPGRKSSRLVLLACAKRPKEAFGNNGKFKTRG